MPSSLAWLPREQVGREHLARLVVTGKEHMGEADTVVCYEDGGLRLGIPRAYARQHFGASADMCIGHKIVCPKKPTPRDQKQEAFFGNILSGMVASPDVFACADTGTGKTVAACNAISTIGRTALIVIDKERIAVQWVKELKLHCGFTDAEVGFVGDGQKRWHGCKVVVGITATLRNGSMPEEFWNYFGIAIFDELHRCAAPISSRVLGLIPARWRLGLTATPKRRDLMHPVFEHHLGKPTVESEQEALPMTTYVHEFDCTWVKKWPQSSVYVDKLLSKIPQRNVLLASVIKQFYDKGRQAIVVSKYINHCYLLRELAILGGVPKEAIGMFLGQVVVDLGNGRVKRRLATAREKTDAQKNYPITLATYGMLTEGIDEPRWDAGLDAIPVASATQLTGRICRTKPGKKHPIWITIMDKGCRQSTGYFWNRVKEYRQRGEVIMPPEWLKRPA